MHRPAVLRLAVATLALVAASAAFAAPNNGKVITATFETLAASGVAGQAQLQSMPGGGTLIHGTLRGLQPGVEYVSVIYQNGGCSALAGDAGTQIVRFTANPSGDAKFNVKAVPELTGIGSVSIQLVSDQSLQACAAVTP